MAKKRDAKVTKKNIIQNAKKIFSKKGFDGTSVDDIAKLSDVNKAMIYYYFQNKANLYEEVISTILKELYEEILKKQKSSTAHDRLKVFIKVYASFCKKHQFLSSLILRELSDGGKNLPNLVFAGLREIFSYLTDILKDGEKSGEFKDVEPMVIHFMITGSINLFISTKSLRKKANRLNPDIQTCPECDVLDVADYIYEKVVKMLEER